MILALKQRIVGAIVLVSLGVIFIPMLFQPPQQPIVIQKRIPPAPTVANSLPEVVKAKPVAVVTQIPTPKSEAAHQAHLVRVAQLKREAAEKTQRAKVVASKTTKSKISAKASPAKTWMILLASFAEKRNADALVKRLKSRGYPVVTQQVKNGGQHMTQLYVGPAQQHKAAAKRRLVELENGFHLKGLIVPSTHLEVKRKTL